MYRIKFYLFFSRFSGLLILFFTFNIIILSCNTDNQPSEDAIKVDLNFNNKNKDSIIFEKYAIDTFWDDYASILSGKKTMKYYDNIIYSKQFTNYQLRLKSGWLMVYEPLIDSINTWKSVYFKSKSFEKTVFYPFGGPDFLYVQALFNPVVSILGGLENIGSASYDSAISPEKFEYLSGSLSHLILAANERGFFITPVMAQAFKDKTNIGVLQVVLFYMKSFNFHISSVKFGSLDQLGNFNVSLNGQYNTLKIEYLDGDKNSKTFYYFQYDLHDQNLKINSELLTFIKQNTPLATFIKSCSYLLHKPYFSIVRNFIKNESSYILQDDSGIPISNFDSTAWNFNFYGKYDNTIKLFDKNFQPLLKQKFYHAKPLNFKFGYNVGENEPNLIYIYKK
ncbi:MAG: hypothetical protein QM539_06790 [Alphaproteobacteria bacterium]|nr:hypothetical protein [Alphaproteobacteria bacterium]